MLLSDLNKDFNSTSFFVRFEVDESHITKNELNFSIPLIGDNIPEDQESFVVTLELQMKCGSEVQIRRGLSLIHITDNDGKFSTCISIASNQQK